MTHIGQKLPVREATREPATIRKAIRTTTGKKMGSKMTEPDLTLYRIVDEVLYYLWDPIGIANSAGPRDEYRMYVPKVFELVRMADGPTLSAYLLSVERDWIGLAGHSASAQRIAELLLAWRVKISEASSP